MPSPFPGMDPFLENSGRWRNFHSNYINGIQRALNRVLPPEFLARTEERVIISVPSRTISPDVAVFATAPARAGNGAVTVTLPRFDPPEVALVEHIRQYFVEVWHLQGERRRLIASVEVLSPTNKTSDGNGWQEYRAKQEKMREMRVHLLELDLLRGGKYALLVPEAMVSTHGGWDYLVNLFDGSQPEQYLFWRVGLRQQLPTVYLPLTEEASPVPLDLQEVFALVYDENRLGEDIDYQSILIPRLSSEDADWVDALLREKGLR